MDTETKVDYNALLKALKGYWKWYAVIVPTITLIAIIYVFSLPRTYTTSTSMVPETSGPTPSGSLSSIASSFGLDISDATMSDAITPIIYPDLMNDNGFLTEIMRFKVTTMDGKLTTDYRNYLIKHQKVAWWLKLVASVKGPGTGIKDLKDPYLPDKKNFALFEKVRKSITMKVDKKTGVVTINATDQDPYICKTLADSVRSLLQVYIIDYRTKKARLDYNHYKHLMAEAKSEYEKARRAYGRFGDANNDVVLQSVRLQTEDLENEMQLKYNAYSAMVQQTDLARAKLQAQTPAFTLITGAAMPTKPSAPKRMIFVGVWFVLSFIITTGITLRKVLKEPTESTAAAA